MKNKEQIRAAKIEALAKLDGIKIGFNDSWPSECPPYLTSYDAIIPLIQKQMLQTRLQMTVDNRISFMSTPDQLADALLAAHGIKIEE